LRTLLLSALGLVMTMANAHSKGGPSRPTWEEVAGPVDLRQAGERALAADPDDALYLEANLVEAAWLTRDGGATWTPTPRRPRPSPAELVVVEAVAPSGARWRSERRTGIATYRGAQPDVLETATAIARRVQRSRDGGRTWTTLRDDLEARAFAFDGEGRVWVAADTRGLFVVEGAEPRWRQVLAARTDGVVVAGARLVVATADAMLVSDDHGARFEPRDDGLGHEDGARYRMQGLALERLLRGPDETVWAIGYQRVCRLAPSSPRWERLDAGLPDYLDHVEAFALTRGGAFLGTRGKGLYRLRERASRSAAGGGAAPRDGGGAGAAPRDTGGGGGGSR
jgi:hypothetical protein